MVETESAYRGKHAGSNVKGKCGSNPPCVPGKLKESVRMQQKQQQIQVRPPPGEVYVGNLDHRISTAEIRKLFGMFGTVTLASIRVASGSPTREAIRPSKKDVPGTYGVVTFTSFLDAVRAAKHLNGFEFRGRSLVVTRNLSQLPERKALISREIKRIERQVPNESFSHMVWGKAVSLTATVANRLTAQPTLTLTDSADRLDRGDESTMCEVWMRAEQIVRQAKAEEEAEVYKI